MDKVSETKNNTYKHTNLYPGRINKDEQDVQSIVNLLDNEWIYPFLKTNDMMIVQSGVVIPAEVTNDITNARNCGDQAFKTFIFTNFSSINHPSEKFHNRMSKKRLKTCFDMGMTRTVRFTGSDMVRKAYRNWQSLVRRDS